MNHKKMKIIFPSILLGLFLLSALTWVSCNRNKNIEKITTTKNSAGDSTAIDSSMLVFNDSLIKITLSLPERSYKVKESIYVTLKITNRKNVDFDIGPLYWPNNRELMFYFLNEKGDLLKYSREGVVIDYIYPAHVVKPNKTVEKQFQVNEYAPQGSLNKGKYRIFSQYRRHGSDTVNFEVVEQ